ncbi:MAG: hypothetical protein RLZZ293_757 [Pseudomonadota bacterium]|jgi:HAD superfamily hydrolase (TIGR01490 family)
MKLVLFDMDHTLVPCDTGTIWSEFLVERNLITPDKVTQRSKFLHDYLAGKLDVVAAYQFELSVLQSLDPIIRPQLLQEFFTTKIQPLITLASQDCVAKHKQAGDYIVMITATIEEIAKPIADFFQVDHLIGGRGKQDSYGNYTGEIELEPCMGRGKLVHLENWLTQTAYNPQHYTFYSDSHNDLPLLEQVDLAIAVDPDPKLSQIAQEQGWPIISFLS